MPNSPENYSLLTYIWVMGLSILGGVVHNITKIKNGTLARFSIPEMVGDIVISAFIGIVTFYLCEYAGFQPPLTAALVGISAHMGTRALVMLEKYVYNKLGVDPK